MPDFVSSFNRTPCMDRLIRVIRRVVPDFDSSKMKGILTKREEKVESSSMVEGKNRSFSNLSILCCVSRAVHLRETMADRYGAVCGPTLYYSLPATPVFHKHVSIPHNRRKRFRKPRYVTVVEEADSMKSMRDTEYITGYIMHTFTRLDIFIAKRFTAVFPDTCLLITRSKYFTGRGRGLNLYDSKPIRRFWPSSLRKLA